jgi:hypothetical protein
MDYSFIVKFSDLVFLWRKFYATKTLKHKRTQMKSNKNNTV